VLAGQAEEPGVDDGLAVDGDEDGAAAGLSSRPDCRVEETGRQLLGGRAWPAFMGSRSIFNFSLRLLSSPHVLLRILPSTNNPLTETLSAAQLHKVLHPWSRPRIHNMGPVPARASWKLSVALDKEDASITDLVPSSLLLALRSGGGRGDPEA